MKKGLFLVAILLVPSIIYLLFSLGKHHTGKLGFDGKYEVSNQGDTNFLALQFPDMVSSDGEKISNSSLEGKVVVIHFFHWPCDEGCKTEFATINNYLNQIGLNERWELLNIAIDSISLSDLGALASMKIYDGKNWFYCAPQSTEQANLLRMNAFESTHDIDHPTSTVVLLDQKQFIRARFDLKMQPQIKLLQDAIKLVVQEPHISWKTKK